MTIKELIESSDPLTDEALQIVLTSREETTLVDYKLTFHTDEEREWLEITKDVIAFANTFGGYLVFGVKDGTYEIVGLDETTLLDLRDPNLLMQKINRYVEPPITSIRCRAIEADSKTCLLLLIPPSHVQTHFVSKDGSFKFPSGQDKTVLRQGTSYVRRSAGNHLVDSRDLDAIVSRRLDYFKSSLMDKIARVVDAPVDSKVLMVSEIQGAEPHSKFVIDNASDALPVKGMSFTVSPSTIEQEIAAWIAMTAADPGALPSTAITWKWYSKRKALKLTETQRIHTAVYCLLNGVPAFFWLQGCKAADIKPALAGALSARIGMDTLAHLLGVAAFLGKRFHGSLVKKLSESVQKRIGHRATTFPASGPREGLRADSVVPKRARPGTPGQLRQQLEQELDAIAVSVKELGIERPELTLQWRAQQVDCHLYAQDNQYA